MPIFNQNPSLQKVVINARGGIQGIGVSTFGGTVLVHDSIIKDTETCSIIFSYIGIKLNASRFITHDDIVLLKVSNFNQIFCTKKKNKKCQFLNCTLCIFMNKYFDLLLAKLRRNEY